MKCVNRTLFALAAAGVCLAVAGCKGKTKAASAEAEKPVVIIGYAKGSLCLAPLHIGYIDGFFDKEFKEAGIPYKMEEVDLNQSAELLAAGKINACVGLTASLIQPIDNGLDITFTTGLHTGCTKYFSRADSKIYSPSDLRGKKIGVSGLSDSATLNIKRKLEDVGIKSSGPDAEVTFVVYALTDLGLALSNGAIDAAGIHDPVAYKAQQQYGFRTILDTGTDDKFKGEYCCTAYVTTKLAKERPDAAAAYTRAIQKAAAYIQALPGEAAKEQYDSGFCAGDLATNAQLLASYNYSPSVSGGRKTFVSASGELQKTGDLKADTDVTKFVAEHFTVLPGVPESVTYDPASKTFSSKKI